MHIANYLSYAAIRIFNAKSRFVSDSKLQQQQQQMALCLGLPGWACTRRNIHPPTILIIIQSLSASSIYYDP